MGKVVDYKCVSLQYLVDFKEKVLVTKSLAPEVNLVVAKENFASHGFAFSKGETLCIDAIVENESSNSYILSKPYGEVRKGKVAKSLVQAKPRENWSTEDVCEYVIKRACMQKECTYLELINPPDAVSEHEYQGTFVSQARKCKFADLVGALEHYYTLKGEELSNQYVWLDIFSVNQPKLTASDVAPATKQEIEKQITEGLHTAIANFDRVVLFMDRWDGATALTRAWCLWEIFGVAQAQKQLEVALPKNEYDRYLVSIVKDVFTVKSKLAKLDVSKADCFSKDDRLVIERAIKAESSHDKVNEVVKSQLRLCIAKIAEGEMIREERRSEPDKERVDLLATSAGFIYQSEGQLQKAEDLLRKALEMSKAVSLDKTKDTNVAERFSNLSQLLKAKGDLVEAERLQEEAMKVRNTQSFCAQFRAELSTVTKAQIAALLVFLLVTVVCNLVIASLVHIPPLQRQLDELSEEFDELTGDLANDLRPTVNGMVAELDNVLEPKINNLKKEHGDLEDDVEELSDELTIAKTDLEAVQSLARELQKRIDELTLEHVERGIKAAESNLTMLQGTIEENIEAIDRNLTESRSRIDSHEQSVHRVVASLQETVARSEVDVETNLTAINRSIGNHKNHVEEELRLIEIQIANGTASANYELQKHQQQLNSNITLIKEEIAELLEDIESASVRCKEIEEKVENVESTSEAMSKIFCAGESIDPNSGFSPVASPNGRFSFKYSTTLSSFQINDAVTSHTVWTTQTNQYQSVSLHLDQVDVVGDSPALLSRLVVLDQNGVTVRDYGLVLRCLYISDSGALKSSDPLGAEVFSTLPRQQLCTRPFQNETGIFKVDDMLCSSDHSHCATLTREGNLIVRDSSNKTISETGTKIGQPRGLVQDGRFCLLGVNQHPATIEVAICSSLDTKIDSSGICLEVSDTGVLLLVNYDYEQPRTFWSDAGFGYDNLITGSPSCVVFPAEMFCFARSAPTAPPLARSSTRFNKLWVGELGSEAMFNGDHLGSVVLPQDFECINLASGQAGCFWTEMGYFYYLEANLLVSSLSPTYQVDAFAAPVVYLSQTSCVSLSLGNVTCHVIGSDSMLYKVELMNGELSRRWKLINTTDIGPLSHSPQCTVLSGLLTCFVASQNTLVQLTQVTPDMYVYARHGGYVGESLSCVQSHVFEGSELILVVDCFTLDQEQRWRMRRVFKPPDYPSDEPPEVSDSAVVIEGQPSVKDSWNTQSLQLHDLPDCIFVHLVSLFEYHCFMVGPQGTLLQIKFTRFTSVEVIDHGGSYTGAPSCLQPSERFSLYITCVLRGANGVAIAKNVTSLQLQH